MTSVEILRSPLLDRAQGVEHAFFTRRGGVSEGIYASLNVGLGSRDEPGRVRENRRRAAERLDLAEDALATVYQVHSAKAVTAAGPWPLDPPQADGLVVCTPGLAAGALAADCAPVLIADPRAGIVAAAHAGWRGALGGVIEATVAQMVAAGARPGDMLAAVGPCIGPRSYEVGPEFEAAFLQQGAGAGPFFSPGDGDRRLFDLPGFVLGRLAAAGVGAAEWIGADTFADPGLFFSNRRAFKAGEPDYGRLLSAIVLKRVNNRRQGNA
ncbi:MAG TPA: polyphenol oxidase family protein [Caulobacteraceae bacterium]|jgi:hypothetical protein|nr:polyphenol oxidase family protein [Caulobacteraceae bacterium]